MKPLWKSKTIIVMLAIIILNAAPDLRAIVPEAWLAPLVAAAAIILRLFTTEPIDLAWMREEDR